MAAEQASLTATSTVTSSDDAQSTQVTLQIEVAQPTQKPDDAVNAELAQPTTSQGEAPQAANSNEKAEIQENAEKRTEKEAEDDSESDSDSDLVDGRGDGNSNENSNGNSNEIKKQKRCGQLPQKKVEKLVIDANAFIKGIRVDTIGEELYTLSEVLDEVRDSKAKQFLASFPFQIKQKQPHPDVLKLVTQFSKITGDYPSLSLTDLKVIALTYTLDKEAHGSDEHLRKTPLAKPELGNTKINANFFNPTVKVKTPKPQNAAAQERSPSSERKSEDMPGWGTGENKAKDQGGWITPDNIEDYTKEFNQLQGAVPLDAQRHRVACLTSDFAMQNVIIQMNLNLISVDGMIIRTAKKWIKRCFGCFKLCKDVEKEFCPECGGHTLQKVSYSVDHEGNIYYNLPRKNKISLRGTIYPIPAPTGGRKNNDLVLCEQVPRRRRKAAKVDLDDPDHLFLEKRNPQAKTTVYGYGKHNPNIARKKIGKKNKTTRRNNM